MLFSHESFVRGECDCISSAYCQAKALSMACIIASEKIVLMDQNLFISCINPQQHAFEAIVLFFLTMHFVKMYNN